MENFRALRIVSRDTKDQLVLRGSSLNDFVDSYENFLRVRYGTSFNHQFTGFKKLYLDVDQGGFDTLRLYDTRAHDLLNLMEKHISTINDDKNNKVRRTMHGFDRVYANAYMGGNNYLVKRAKKISYQFFKRGNWQ